MTAPLTSKNTSSELTLTLHNRIRDIPEEDWSACAGTDNVFVSYGFLSALEESGTTGKATGWIPEHAAFRDEVGQIVCVVPLYIKLHSYGEYVFDHGWAQALEAAGGTYYPKLQAAIPFSPVPGPRLLRRPGASIDIKTIADTLASACRQLDMSSVHVTFPSESEWAQLGDAGWLQRTGIQFHWHNQGYKSFDDFLATLTSNHRKSIRRERRDANNCGLTYLTLSGHQIEKRHWDAFYAFYQSTVDRKWGSAYLSRSFFTQLSKNLGEKVVLMMAEHDGELVAGALNMRGPTTLWGRNWGCVGDWPFLHFELCYYRAIDYAIQNNLETVEAGAQGHHKIQRGYLPQKTFSAHHIVHPGLSHAVEQFLVQERSGIDREIEALEELSPFKQTEVPVG